MKRTALTRKPMKRSQPKRDWTEARAKVEREGSCRLCGTTVELEAAHVVGRTKDFFGLSTGTLLMKLTGPLKVEPDRIVPLCRDCHRAYDAHEVDLLPVLFVREQTQAVADSSGIENARVRLCPSQYRSER